MNVDKAKGEVEVEFAGETRRFKFTTNVFCDIEQELGEECFSGKFLTKPSFKSLRATVWSLLKRENSKIKLDEVGEMLEIAGIPDILPALYAAYALAMPKLDDKGAEAKNGETATQAA
jgi:hypothetical protein